jgi:hypothetical protein
VAPQVVAQLGDDDGDAADDGLVEPLVAGQAAGGASRLADLRWLGDRNVDVRDHATSSARW